MAVEHKNIVDAERHEPKGASTAASGSVYVSDGAGSGTWVDPLASVNNSNLITLNVDIPDISTASSIFVATPLAGVISKIFVCLHAAITTADATVTAEINGVAVTGISILCAFTGSAPGSVFSDTASASNTLLLGDAIEIITDGGSTGTAAATVTILINTA